VPLTFAACLWLASGTDSDFIRGFGDGWASIDQSTPHATARSVRFGSVPAGLFGSVPACRDTLWIFPSRQHAMLTRPAENGQEQTVSVLSPMI